MKLKHDERQVTRINTSGERKFSIKPSGKAFRILSSGLYKEKILAIVREISCNAYDAHIASGQRSRPFDVHLPNALEPWFSVRDYGPGLSDEHMTTVYTTYFESTKTESEDEIGALGLGSKSPLAYVDSFGTTSFFEGIKRAYTVFWNEYDEPSISLMSEEPTDQPNGLEIYIPVSNGGFYQFQKAAQEVYRYFTPLPNITGCRNFEIAEKNVLMEGDGYQIFDRRIQTSPLALMGIVAYPLNPGNTEEFTASGKALLTCPITIDFKLGSLGVTAGREELSYDGFTMTAIAERLEEVEADIRSRLDAQINACKTEYEARKLYAELSRIQFFRNFYPDGFKFGEKAINEPTFTLNMLSYGNGVTVFHYPSANSGYYDQLPGAKKYVGGETKFVAIPADDSVLVIKDDLNGKNFVPSRIRQFRQQNRDKTIYLIRTLDTFQTTKIVDENDPENFKLESSVSITGDDSRAKVLGVLDGFSFGNVSEMEKPVFTKAMSGPMPKTIDERFATLHSPATSTAIRGLLALLADAIEAKETAEPLPPSVTPKVMSDGYVYLVDENGEIIRDQTRIDAFIKESREAGIECWDKDGKPISREDARAEFNEKFSHYSTLLKWATRDRSKDEQASEPAPVDEIAEKLIEEAINESKEVIKKAEEAIKEAAESVDPDEEEARLKAEEEAARRREAEDQQASEFGAKVFAEEEEAAYARIDAMDAFTPEDVDHARSVGIIKAANRIIGHYMNPPKTIQYPDFKPYFNTVFYRVDDVSDVDIVESILMYMEDEIIKSFPEEVRFKAQRLYRQTMSHVREYLNKNWSETHQLRLSGDFDVAVWVREETEKVYKSFKSIFDFKYPKTNDGEQ